MRAQMFFRLIFFCLLFCLPCFHSLSSQFLTLPSNETIVSPRNVFEFGFFQPDRLIPRWFLGIWYKQDSNRTCLWVANRDNPLLSPNGTLKFFNNDLVLFDEGSDIVWKANITGGNENSDMVAQILDNGNLVVKDSNDTKEDYLWQSFDSPTNTLLPQMKLTTLVSWRNATDPRSGRFWFGISSEEHFFASYVVEFIFVPYYWSFDPWNGYRFGDMPPVLQLDDNTDMFVMKPESNYSRLTLNPEGDYGLYTWIPEAMKWKLSWTSKDVCFTHETCGTYSYCSKDASQLPFQRCHCIQGFNPKLENPWSGCVRKIGLNCSGDRFVKLQNMSLPRITYLKLESETGTVEGCEKACLMDCLCTAFAHVETGKGQRQCLTWTGEFNDMRNYTLGGQDLYVRLAPASHEAKETSTKKGLSTREIIGLIFGSLAVFAILCICCCFCFRFRKRAADTHGPSEIELLRNEITGEDQLVSVMDFNTISEATDHFSESNLVGRGGFGDVYKGQLLDGQEIAAKKLSKMSRQGIVEFKAEIQLIANLQHINLVRLIGWTAHDGEMVLVYEYLENGGLESHLFGGGQSSSKLNWHTKYQVIKGIARGLAYLHHDSRITTIHRDLKPENVLLTRDFVPKISDFGMARILERNDNDAWTTRAAGTRAYMSPEYVLTGRYSPQSDTFSFGVMVLEIISGKKNSTFSNSRSDTNFLSFMWKNWKEGNWQENVEEAIQASSPSQILRSIEIGLLCVQQFVKDRPLMSTVMSLLENEALEVPKVKPPGYFMDGRGPNNYDIGESSTAPSASVNVITLQDVTLR